VAAQTAAAVATPAAETPAPQTPAADVVAGGDQLGFRFGADAWIEVRDSSGAILHAGTNRAGSSRIVQGKPPFRLIVGNSAKVVLEHDGKPVDLAPHTRGSVARLTLP
jgi:cytoskeleton protein RodZ